MLGANLGCFSHGDVSVMIFEWLFKTGSTVCNLPYQVQVGKHPERDDNTLTWVKVQNLQNPEL